MNVDYENRIVELINEKRVAEGRIAYRVNWRLVASARGYSTDMACNGARNHIGSDGSTASERIAAQGYTYWYIGENYYIGWGSGGTPEAAFEWWINSTPHLNNIMHTGFQEFGVGYMFDPARNLGFYTINFARPR
jgi:uncharacterized protein YkwD